MRRSRSGSGVRDGSGCVCVAGPNRAGSAYSRATTAQVRRRPDPAEHALGRGSGSRGLRDRLTCESTFLARFSFSAPFQTPSYTSPQILTVLRQTMHGINIALLGFFLGGFGVATSSASFVCPSNARPISPFTLVRSTDSDPCTATSRRLRCLSLR